VPIWSSLDAARFNRLSGVFAHTPMGSFKNRRARCWAS